MTLKNEIKVSWVHNSTVDDTSSGTVPTLELSENNLKKVKYKHESPRK